jgi:limonene 1,2-monooxygenase
MSAIPLQHGIFMAPYHDIDESPTMAPRRDIQLVAHLDGLGFRDAWFGEHHCTGWEVIGSPELMIAAATENTKQMLAGVRRDFEALQDERQEGVDLAFAKWSDRSKHRP